MVLISVGSFCRVFHSEFGNFGLLFFLVSLDKYVNFLDFSKNVLLILLIFLYCFTILHVVYFYFIIYYFLSSSCFGFSLLFFFQCIKVED